MVTELIDGYRLSPQQRRVWRLQQLDGNSYRTLAGVLLEGRVQQNRLQSALAEVLARHEILRTEFRQVPGMSFPLQVVNPEASPAITFQDLADLGPAERNARLDQLFRQMMRQPFAYNGGTPLQASLASLSQSKHVLFLGLPALCADRASLGNLAHEIARFYDGSSANGEDTVQYVEASEVFLELLESEETEAGRDYWRLQNLPDLRALKLPLERQLGTGTSFAPALLNFKLDGRTMSEIERVAGESGTTTAVFFLACWHVLLWRLTGQSDMMVGFASDGRTHEDLKDALGLYERYLPIRSLLGSAISFAEVLQQLDKTTNEALSRQDYFDWSQIAGFDSGDAKLPPCPFMLDFDAPPQADATADITLRMVRQYSCSDRFRLKLVACPVEDGLALSLHYDSSLYGRKQAATLARHYLTLLSSAVAEPSAKAGSLNLLHPTQRRRLQRYTKHPQPATPPVAPFHEQFARQASRTPDAIAIRDDAGQVTYRELDQRSNQLARYLTRLGVGPERVVAIHMPRSLQMVEAVLGVLKAGGAYLPLDPNAPEERMRLMIENAGAVVVLTGIDEQTADVSTEPLNTEVSEQNLAYIVYTSGSTGRPKGVMVQHGSVSEYLAWVNNTLLAGPVESLPVATNLSFDMCLKQLFAPLVSGNEAWLLPEDVVTQPTALVRTLSGRQQFGFNCVPSLWKAILDSVEPAEAALLSQ
ncbi:MAG TPA: condensation domain-containing protein, partial [Pyrinomonadaceae bacterium]